VADETIRVIHAERGVALAPDGATYVEKTLTPFVLPKAAAHRSSMLQDVEAGRRTEIDYLNGAVVRMGQGRTSATPAMTPWRASSRARAQRRCARSRARDRARDPADFATEEVGSVDG
jgi:ketopantoate reductase